MKPPIEYRPNRQKARDKVAETIAEEMKKPAKLIFEVAMTPEQILLHKRLLKAAQMRRYRARRKEREG